MSERGRGAERIYAFADELKAAAGEVEEEREELESWLALKVAGTAFALPVEYLREVLRAGSMTRVPGAPQSVRGVIAVRGAVLPVVDLGERLGFGRLATSETTRVLIVESRGRRIGLLADAAEKIVSLAPSTVTPPPSDLLPTEGVAAGVCETEAGRLVLLDLAALLTLEEDDGQATAAADR